MNILHVYKDYFPVLGGIENHIKLLAETQAQRGHAVSVLATSRDGRTHVETLNGVRVIFAARLATVASTPLSAALPLQLTRERPDIVHLHFPYPVGDVAHRFLGRARRTVITYHSDIVRQKNLLRFYAPFLRLSLARADRIIATSPRYIETSPFLAPHALKCTVVPYGIDVARFATADAAQVACIRAQFGEPLILFVGQFRYYKGVEYLVRAMAQTPGRALLIGNETPPLSAELEALARSLGVANRVFLLGEKDVELPAFYHACDVFVLPSIERSEAFGIVLLEAMASGLPCVTTEVGSGTSYVVEHNVTGCVVPPRAPDALADALNRLVADPALRARMGAAGRERAVRLFRFEDMVARVEAVYREALAGRPGL